MSYVSRLKLFNFRCYQSVDFEGLDSDLIVLYGPNGAGKTNVLEALSMLSPGRGLRGAGVHELQNENMPDPWAIASTISSHITDVQIGTGYDQRQGKRMVRIQGETAKGQAALSDYVSCVWLTPQMDRLFLDSSKERRRFLDRLVFAFDPSHAGRVTRYENAMRQRSRLLQEGKADPRWLDSLESQMAQSAVSITAARLHCIEHLEAAQNKEPAPMNNNPFPQAGLEVKGTLEQFLRLMPALEVEELFKYQLQESRGIDMQTGGAATGPHKSDLAVTYVAKNMPAYQCSTGEQKALLIGIVLAHARLIASEREAAPILLLDEIGAHLDEQRRASLFKLLKAIGGQVWLTGTDENLFTAIKNDAVFFKIENGKVV